MHLLKTRLGVIVFADEMQQAVDRIEQDFFADTVAPALGLPAGLIQTNHDVPIDFRGRGRGWIVPRLVKVNENLSDMETFFERWMTIASWAVIDRAHHGMGLIPDLCPVPMDPPRKKPAKNQQKKHLTVLSDGTVTLCAQDWLGRAALGDANENTLAALWQEAPKLSDTIAALAENERPICHTCQDWLAVQPALACH